MANKLIVANWKENPATERAALKLFSETAKVKRRSGIQVVVCPPVVYLERIAKKFRALRSKSGIVLGAQDVFWEEQGAHTGEIGSLMLESFGVQYVIIGHSERRRLLHETDAMVNKKVRAAQNAGLKVILCVGEPLSVRRKGISVAKRFVKNQLKKDLKNIAGSVDPVRRRDDIIIAYEPIWAIGTGRSDSPKDASEMAGFIKGILDSRVLYGGSVNSKNIGDYVDSKGIDGALVGGASLKSGEFGKMIQSI
jgi:triosephosphate isomerase